MTDWTGNANSIYMTLGASNHTTKERQAEDYYATEPKAAELLCDLMELSPRVWECACGGGHLAKVFTGRGYDVTATDLINRGYGCGGVDFLQCTEIFDGDIITNPPYKYAQQFVEKALELIPRGRRVAMFLKLTFMEGKKRRELFEQHPPKYIFVSSSRLQCAKNADFAGMQAGGGSAIAHAWYVWEKGYHGETVVKWFN